MFFDFVKYLIYKLQYENHQFEEISTVSWSDKFRETMPKKENVFVNLECIYCNNQYCINRGPTADSVVMYSNTCHHCGLPAHLRFVVSIISIFTWMKFSRSEELKFRVFRCYCRFLSSPLTELWSGKTTLAAGQLHISLQPQALMKCVSSIVKKTIVHIKIHEKISISFK